MNFSEYVEDNVLSVEKSTINMSELVGFLKDNRNITKLSLHWCNIDNKDAKELAKLTSISSLDLCGTKISIEAVKALAELTNLTELNLRYAWQVDTFYIILISIIAILLLCTFLYMFLVNTTFTPEYAALISSIIFVCIASALVSTIFTYVTEVLNDRQSSKYVEALANGNLSNLTSLDLHSNKIGDKGIEALARGNLPNLTSLDLHSNEIGDKGIEALARGNLPNLTSLDLGWNKIGDKGIEALARGNLLNLTSLDLHSNKIGDKGIEALARGNLPNLTSLDLGWNKIGDRGIEALTRGSLPNLASFKLLDGEISYKAVETLAKSHYLKFRAHNRDCEYRGDKSDIYKLLIELYSQNKSVDNFSPDNIKKAVFYATRMIHGKEAIEYVLERPDKYPFLINSKDEQGYTLFYFYNYNPEIQQFLFEHGVIPEQERNQRRDDERIAQDSQSVHASPIVKRTNFFTKKITLRSVENGHS